MCLGYSVAGTPNTIQISAPTCQRRVQAGVASVLDDNSKRDPDPPIFLQLHSVHHLQNSVKMSASQQILLGALHTLTKPLFEPLLTGPLLYLITKGPDQIRIPLLVGLSKLPVNLDTDKVVLVLKWLVAVGAISKVNQWLNDLALNHWRLFADKKAWKWDKELAVVTGGSSGIGKVIVEGLEKAGVKVAVIDIQPLPKDLAKSEQALPRLHEIH